MISLLSSLIEETTNKYAKRFYLALKNRNFDVYGDDHYKSSHEHVNVIDKKCGYVWRVTPNNLVRSDKGCPKCNGNNKKTTKDFKAEVYDLVGEEYEVVGDYRGANHYVTMKHNTCGKLMESTTASGFLMGTRCHNCSKPNQNRDTNSFENEVFELTGKEYKVLGEYTSARDTIKMKHTHCGNVWETTTAYSFLAGTRCPKCYGNIKKDADEFKEEIYHLYGDEYEVSGEYQGNKTPIKMKHKECGNYWDTSTPINIIRGLSGCVHCNSSKGEVAVSKYLKDKNIKFIPFKRFKDLAHLEYDFYLPEEKLLIEFDGLHHYEPVDFSGRGVEWSSNQYKQQLIRDDIKNNYADENKIRLIRIPYWEIDNIDVILNKIILG